MRFTASHLGFVTDPRLKSLVEYRTIGAVKAALRGEELDDERVDEIKKTLSALKKAEVLQDRAAQYFLGYWGHHGQMPRWTAQFLTPIADGKFGRFRGKRPKLDDPEFRKGFMRAMQEFERVWTEQYQAQEGSWVPAPPTRTQPRRRGHRRGRTSA